MFSSPQVEGFVVLNFFPFWTSPFIRCAVTDVRFGCMQNATKFPATFSRFIHYT